MKKVAVITRTQNRPILLRRAMQSVLDQTFKDFTWVVVNDAGNKESVEQIVSLARESGIDAQHLYRPKSSGMEAASNHGVLSSSSEYLVIHDDDDSWDPSFLNQTVTFLDNNLAYSGVVSQSIRVDEEVTSSDVIILNRSPYRPSLMSIQMSDMLLENQFPPISFLFRRSLYDEVGGFNEKLPVLGDWDFHLKALLNSDLGVIPAPLANYHFRTLSATAQKNDAYGNSLTSSVDKHIEYDAKFRNQMFRDDVANNVLGLGTMLVTSRQLMMLDKKLSAAELRAQKFKRALSRIPFAKKLLSS